MNPSNASPSSSAGTPKSPGLPPTPPASLAGSSASGNPGSSARNAAREKAEQIKSATADAAEQIKEEASDAVAGLKEKTAEMAHERRQHMADRIGDYSSSIRDTARSVEDKDPNIAWFTERAADRLQGVADYVRQADFRRLRDDAEDLARRHPAVALSGLFISGLLLGSALKVGRSAPGSDRREPEPPYGTESGFGVEEPTGSPLSSAPESSQI